MNTSDFYYDLPKELIAQHPLENRSSSRLMVISKEEESISHDNFYNILKYLKKGDLLVLNNTKVIPARIFGRREAKDESIEFLLLKQVKEDLWQCLSKPGRKAKIGTRIIFSDRLEATVEDIDEEGQRYIKFEYNGIFEEILDEIGQMPLPPYITEKLEEQDRYQTVYSLIKGSAAAPTAGLHFTKKLLKELEDNGIEIAYITLHVGLGTFRPVKVDDVTNHKMHSEVYYVNKMAAEKINKAKKENRRVICVGTTSIRTLESIADEKGFVKETSGSTDIFIYPGYSFKCVDGLITNFHLPESTLIMLVSAFASKEFIMRAYEEAIKEKYRFFSFGDAMFIY